MKVIGYKKDYKDSKKKPNQTKQTRFNAHFTDGECVKYDLDLNNKCL